MPEAIEPRQTNLRLDPSLHLMMKGAKDVLGLPSVDSVYSQAIREFFVNHPELVTGVLEQLQTEVAVVRGAVERLHTFRGDET